MPINTCGVLTRIIIKFIISISIFILLLPPLLAEDPDLKALQGLGDTRYHRLNSQRLEQTYHIFVRLPESYDPKQAYPTVYLLDGGYTFPMLGAYYRYLQLDKELPAMIVVGISYGTDDWQQGNMRSRDFTAKAPDRDHWGGAADFQAVLRDEIIPLVEGQYRADPARRIIFGQSIGGQFVLYCAQTDPHLFWGYIASNPALHRNLDFFLETRPEDAETASQPRLFVASGSEDDPRFREPALAWMAHWSGQSALPWSLKTSTLDEHGHFSAAPIAFREGLRWIFEK
jgi:predicted alpha/beta superfamily hydrolase